MLEGFSRRLLPLLQLTRMALVFTAIADAYATVLMARHVPVVTNIYNDLDPKPDPLEPRLMLAVAGISVGLYGYGMSLNDIADRRRDRQISPHRPLPSGRVGVLTAHGLMLFLVMGALGAAAFYSHVVGNWSCLLLAVWTAALISFYDLAGKFLVAVGLVALGLIRFFHALVPGPWVPVLWHPLFLLNHVTILSAVCYHWEEKRPALTRAHWFTVFGGLALIDVLFIGCLVYQRGWNHLIAIPEDDLVMDWPLIPPICSALVFIAFAWWIRRRSRTRREAGQTVMLFGLLWLIVYDAAFVAAYVDELQGILLVLLFPLAYASVQLMRWWSKLISLSQSPEFKRARA